MLIAILPSVSFAFALCAFPDGGVAHPFTAFDDIHDQRAFYVMDKGFD